MQDLSSLQEFIIGAVQNDGEFTFTKLAEDLTSEKPTTDFAVRGETYQVQSEPGKNVGSVLWRGTRPLAEFLLDNCELSNRRVVELGAGVGILSAVAARHGAQVIATELKELLPGIEENLQLNNLQDVNVMEFNLQTMDVSDVFSEPEYDYVIGSELVYDPKITAGLANAVEKFVLEKNARVILSFQDQWKRAQAVLFERLNPYLIHRFQAKNDVHVAIFEAIRRVEIWGLPQKSFELDSLFKHLGRKYRIVELCMGDRELILECDSHDEAIELCKNYNSTHFQGVIIGLRQSAKLG